MKRIRWNCVSLIFAREVRDQLRDRRTLFMIGVLPLLLYPIIGMSFMQMGQFLRHNTSRIEIVSHEPLLDQPPLVRDGQLVGLPNAEAHRAAVNIRQVDEWHIGRDDMEATARIERGQLDVLVYFPPGFNQRIEALRQACAAAEHSAAANAEARDLAEDASADTDISPKVYYIAAKDRSRVAFGKLDIALNHWRRAIAQDALRRSEIALNATTPFELAHCDVSRPVLKQTAIWSKILPFIIVIWAMTGAFYPAVDLCAGEKERGTLETLLCSPAERIEIVWGKLFTVIVFSMATAVLNLFCMSLTSMFITAQVSSFVSAEALKVLGVPPLSSYVWLLLALVPISSLFSALSLALATMARSTKEGQYYLMPLLLLTMPLLLLPLLPSVELDLGTSLLPVTGLVLLLRQLMEHDFRQALIFLAPVTLVTCACCWGAIRWAVDQFNNESVLFRESELFSLQRWAAQLMRDRLPTPTAAQAVLCALVIILVRFFAGMSTRAPEDWASFAHTAALTLICLVLVPAVLMAVVLTTRPTLSLLMRSTSLFSLCAAAALAVALHPAAVLLLTIVRTIYPMDESMLAPFQQVIRQAPSTSSLVMILALLPAVCEEFAFRGFILSGLRHLGNKYRAILLSAFLFGVAHGVIQQSIVAGTFGMVLGFVAVQTGSIWPAIVFHAVHNTMGVLSSRWMELAVSSAGSGELLVRQMTVEGRPVIMYSPLVVVIGCAVAMVILHWFHQQPTEHSTEERLHDALDHQRNQPAILT